jgi:hypothetical protein
VSAPTSTAPVSGACRSAAASPSTPRDRSFVGRLCDKIDADNRQRADEDAAIVESIRNQPPVQRPKHQPPDRAILWRIIRGMFTGPVTVMLAGGIFVRCERTAVVQLPDGGQSASHVKLIGAVHESQLPLWSGPLDAEVAPEQIIFVAAVDPCEPEKSGGRAA